MPLHRKRNFRPWFAALGSLLAWACASSVPDPSASLPAAASGADSASLRFQLIYVVHGDGGYSYYDQAGRRHLADTEAVAQAEAVARAPGAEVFVFHQKPSPWPRFPSACDGMMRQYRYGRLLRSEAYRRGPGNVDGMDDMAAEAALYRKYAVFPAPAAGAAEGGGPARFFLYFGHEIPVTGGIPYSRSRPELGFSLASFARGLGRFAGPPAPGKPFALIALSSCHGGTPAATSALAPYAPYLLASPGELHLSYLDTRALASMAGLGPETLGQGNPRHPDSPDSLRAQTWGRILAAESFTHLQGQTATAITLSLYETDKAAAYLRAHEEAWAKSGPAPSAAAPIGNAGLAQTQAYADCAANPAFGPGGEAAGVTVYYRAPLFGSEKEKAAPFASGWECPVQALSLASRP